MDYCNGIWSNGAFGDRGWLAIALVIFATWKPLFAILGSYLFGALYVLYNYVDAFFGIKLSMPMIPLPDAPLCGDDSGADYCQRAQQKGKSAAGKSGKQLFPRRPVAKETQKRAVLAGRRHGPFCFEFFKAVSSGSERKVRGVKSQRKGSRRDFSLLRLPFPVFPQFLIADFPIPEIEFKILFADRS